MNFKHKTIHDLKVLFIVGTLAFAGLGNNALAAKPDKPGGGGGGGKEEAPTRLVFDDVAGDSVQSDNGTPYTDDKKANVSVKLSHDGHLRLETNSSPHVGAGRQIFVDFGTDVTLAPGTSNEMTIQTTDGALADSRVLAVEAVVGLGISQGSFDLFSMEEGVPEYNVNLNMRLFFTFTDGTGDGLLIRLAPVPLDNGRDCPSSDPVTVTYYGVDNNTGLQSWRIETQPVYYGACISRSGEGEFGDSGLLTDVQTADLAAGHVALDFGFTLMAAP